jgi:hypothetical protein
VFRGEEPPVVIRFLRDAQVPFLAVAIVIALGTRVMDF